RCILSSRPVFVFSAPLHPQQRPLYSAYCSLLTVHRFRVQPMPVLISMLRAVNLVHHNRIKMETLRALYSSLKFDNPQTYLQSGHVIFKTREPKPNVVATPTQPGIEKKFPCRTDIILRTSAEL